MSTFSELIRKKEGILRRLTPLSVRQLEIVRSGDMSRLIPFLGQKQRILAEFEEVEKLLGPFRDIPPEKRTWSNARERHETGEAIRRCATMLEEILQNDSQSVEETAAQKDRLEEGVRRIQQGSRAHSSYAKQAPETKTIRRFDVSE